MLRTILFAAVASSSHAFMLPGAVASLTLQETKGFEVTAHGLVRALRIYKSSQRLLPGFSGRTPRHTHPRGAPIVASSPTPSTRRLLDGP